MFTRLVSQLSLSPSAASQLTFYARRLAQERVSRTFSAIAAVLIIGLQFATIAAPPTPANAASPNDLIYGGVISKNDLLNRYDKSKELQAIYGHWGVTRLDIVDARLTTIDSRDHSLKSLGRLQHLASDTPIKIDGVTYWQRALHTWDTGSFARTGSTYKVFEGVRSDGGFFAIMLACGNIVVKSNLKPMPSPAPKPTPPPTVKPPTKNSVVCAKLIADQTSGTIPLKVTFTGYGAASGQTISAYQFNFGDNLSSVGPSSTARHTYTKPGTYIARLQLKSSKGQVTAVSLPCSTTIMATSIPASFQKSKTAENLTQDINATTKPAQAGDQIRYTLYTKNTGGTAANYVVTEHLNDVLEYANVTDSGGGSLREGVMSWPAADIKPGQTLVNSFVVTVKNPIPATPVGTSDKYSYDLNMDNVYGNAIRVAVQPPAAKLVEGASIVLPQTGSGASTTVTLIVCGLTLFFYLRNRQLIREVKLLRQQYHGGA